VDVAKLGLSRERILAFRRKAGALDERLPAGESSLRQAAWAGLPDSMPRAAVLSIHARVAGTGPATWEDPSLIQLWGPGYSAYVVAARDVGVFSLGRLPDDSRGRQRAEDLAARLDTYLNGRRLSYADAGQALGVHPNSLRYAAPTGTVLIRWEGARRPVIWTVPRPAISPREARLELARRYLHVYGPTTAEAFGRWAGIRGRYRAAVFETLGGELVPVTTPLGNSWILAADEAGYRAVATAVGAHGTAAGGGTGPASPTVRLLPSGDSYLLLHGADRELMVPDPALRDQLWTPRVWPGGLLVDGEVTGTWRRAGAVVNIQPWRRLSGPERDAVVAEAESLPLPGPRPGPITVRFS
jgi:hypothetical protein